MTANANSKITSYPKNHCGLVNIYAMYLGKEQGFYSLWNISGIGR
jgi:hypothetical protein